MLEGELDPPNPSRTGEYWLHRHWEGDTDTGYTSWSTNPYVAKAMAEEAIQEHGLEPGVLVGRVRADSIEDCRKFEGSAFTDEEEVTVEGTVTGIQVDPVWSSLPD
tara:strand:- start:162 stop:479 length:318 start_codon:yes stop_codon:yes gene_type:complete